MSLSLRESLFNPINPSNLGANCSLQITKCGNKEKHPCCETQPPQSQGAAVLTLGIPKG